MLDLAYVECQRLETSKASEALPLLDALAQASNTTLAAAADRVRIEFADRQDALVQSEVRRLQALAQVSATRDHRDLDSLFVRYGCHD